MTLPDGCLAQVLVDGRPRLKRARIEPREPLATRGSGDAFLAGLSGGALRRPGARPVPALRRRLRRRVHRRASAPGLIDAREARRLMGEVELIESAVDEAATAGPAERQPPATSRRRKTR